MSYIWYKNGKVKQRSTDRLGKLITMKVLSDTEYVEYQYYYDNLVAMEAYYKNGVWHKDIDKPAVIVYNLDGNVEKEFYYKNGNMHRDGDKPALVEYNRMRVIVRESYYHNGVEYNPNKN